MYYSFTLCIPPTLQHGDVVYAQFNDATSPHV